MDEDDDKMIWPPPIPRVYRDHRKFIYQLTVSKTLTHSDKNQEGKKHWCVVQFRNISPPQPMNSWNFETKKEAEDFMVKKNPPQKAGDNDNEIKVLVTIKDGAVTAKLL